MMQPTIYYIGYLPPKTGGELVNLQHVASLRNLGVRAVALVNQTSLASDLPEGFSFPIEQLNPDRKFLPQDIIVIPEYYRDAFEYFAKLNCLRVIHTQGPFLSFRGFDSIEDMNKNGLMAGIACSHFCADLMQRMGSTLSWQVVTPFIHPLFKPRNIAKKLQVAYMPDKRPKESPVVISLFKNTYPHLKHIPWIPISGMSRAECARVMAESAVFASFSYLEGLGLPPLEAMSSNCLVCGFDGHGGSDFANEENGLWVKEGDHDGFASAVAECLALAQAGGELLTHSLEAGQKTVALYSQPRFEKELLQAWQTILGDGWSSYLL